jgi:hypothetical protein
LGREIEDGRIEASLKVIIYNSAEEALRPLDTLNDGNVASSSTTNAMIELLHMVIYSLVPPEGSEPTVVVPRCRQ